jgi:hypothetical protein
MVSRENAVILVFATAGLVLAYTGRVVTDLDDAVLIGAVVFMGVVAPQVLNSYLDTEDGD